MAGVAASAQVLLHPLGEVGAVGEARQRIVMRHEVDPFFGMHAGRDVLEQQHRPVLPGADADLAILLAGQHQQHLAIAPLVDHAGQGPRGILGHHTPRCGIGKERGKRPTIPTAGSEPAEHGLGLVIGDHNQASRVEHADAVLHGLERRIEFEREARGFDPTMHGLEQDLPDIGRHIAQAGEIREENERECRRMGMSVKEHADPGRDADQHDLEHHHALDGKIAGRNTHQDRHGYAQARHFGKRRVDHEEAVAGPATIEQGNGASAQRGAQFPALRLWHIGLA